MSVNWFPGHMHKAKEEIRAAMRNVNLVVELLDARIPFSSSNPIVKELRGSKPFVRVLNKSDLADKKCTKAWISALGKAGEGVTVVETVSMEPGGPHRVLGRVRKILDQNRSTERVSTIMVLGIPNVGKSMFINALARRKICKTANTPGVTRNQQLIKLNQKINLLDTPGVLWPKLDPPECGLRLAATGAIGDRAFDTEEVAIFVADYMLNWNPKVVFDTYKLKNVTDPEDGEDLLRLIGKRFGMLESGGVVNMQRASDQLLYDLQNGRLGPVTLETPDMIDPSLL